MTSSHHIGNNTSAYCDAKKLESILEDAGFSVVRVKIETVPWHPAAPVNVGDKMPEDCYFEAHIGCIIYPEQKEKLLECSIFHGAHISRNYFKKLEDGRFVNMITLRDYDCIWNTFERMVESLKNSLTVDGIDFEKVITEFSIYDTKVSHDFKWLEKVNK
jgi:hypothetical protein